MHGVVLAVELESLINRGAVHGGLQMPPDPEPVLEANDRSLIEAEEITGLMTEAAVPEIAVEPMGELKVRSAPWKSQRGRQGNEAKIRFGQLQRTVIVGRRRG